MIKITVRVDFDPDKFIEDYEERASKALFEVMGVAADEWKKEAGQKLNTTRRAYQDAIQTKVISPTEVKIYLQHEDDMDNWLVNALEGGHGPMLPWRSTLAGRKAFYYSPCAKKANQYKWGQQFSAKPPFMDVPNRKGLSSSPNTKCPSVNGFKRLTAKNSPKWTHLGFRPIGKGGLERPLREIVAEFLEEAIPRAFNEALSKKKG